MGIARIVAPHRKYLPEILPQDFVDILLVLCLSFFNRKTYAGFACVIGGCTRQ
jgi:hypothetical protein